MNEADDENNDDFNYEWSRWRKQLIMTFIMNEADDENNDDL